MNMTNALVSASARSADELRDQVKHIQSVMQAVMKDGIHYGKIPGTDKPTLRKPGAEVLGSTFHIRPEFIVEDLGNGDAYRYRVTCRGIHQPTGTIIADGVGSASSNEEKYKWRRSLCAEEFEETPETRRRIKYGKKRDGGYYKQSQIRTEPDDIDNTVLKMACKRAHVAMILNALAASDIFTQDLEDLPEELHPEGDTESREAGNGDSGSGPKVDAAKVPAKEPLIKHVRDKAERAGIKEEDLCKKIGVESLNGASIAVVNAAMKAIEKWATA